MTETLGITLNLLIVKEILYVYIQIVENKIMNTRETKYFSKLRFYSQLRKILLFKINEVRDLQIFIFRITVLGLFLAILIYITSYLHGYISIAI